MRSIDGEVVQRKRCPSYNLSVSLRLDSSPGRGAFGIEEREVSKLMDSEKVIKRDNDYVLHTYNRNPIALEKGHGLYAEGPEGQKYLDFTSGIGVNSLGYCDLTWAEAVSEQAHKLQHTSNLYYTAPCGKLAKKLCKRTGMSKVFFGNSGAEANEGAIKAARKYSVDHYGKDRTTVITLVNSFHGRTIATLTATGQEVFHNYFGPFNEGFQYVKAGDISALTEMVDRHTCAVMLELVQEIGTKLRTHKKKAGGIAISIRNNELFTKEWQCRISIPTQSPTYLAKTAFVLFDKNYQWEHPIRSVTVRAINLFEEDCPIQYDLFTDMKSLDRQERLDAAIEQIRFRFGKDAIKNGVLFQKSKMPTERKVDLVMPTGMIG